MNYLLRAERTCCVSVILVFVVPQATQYIQTLRSERNGKPEVEIFDEKTDGVSSCLNTVELKGIFSEFRKLNKKEE